MFFYYLFIYFFWNIFFQGSQIWCQKWVLLFEIKIKSIFNKQTTHTSKFVFTYICTSHLHGAHFGSNFWLKPFGMLCFFVWPTEKSELQFFFHMSTSEMLALCCALMYRTVWSKIFEFPVYEMLSFTACSRSSSLKVSYSMISTIISTFTKSVNQYLNQSRLLLQPQT